MKNFFYAFVSLLSLIGLSILPDTAFGQKYCSPSFSGCSTSSVVGDSISYFQFGTYTRTAPCIGYDTTQVKSSVLTIYRGKSYPLLIESSSSTDQYGAWIDYNRNGSFEDTSELIAGDFNGSFSQLRTTVKIPINATPVVTRMRIMTNHGSSTMTYNSDCNAWSTAGSAQDYKITVTAYPNDIAIMALNSPQDYACPSAAVKVQVTLRNIGLNNLKNIPMVIKFGTTTINATYNRTIVSNTTDTFTVGYINANSSGIYKFAVYTNLSGDGDRTNDTLNAAVNIRKAANPLLKDVNHCGPGSVLFPGTSTSLASTTYWFTSATGTTPFAIQDTIQVPYLKVGASATYYAESRFKNTGSLQKGSWSASRANYGNFFEVFAKRDLSIDSLEVNSGSTSTDSVTIYWRNGSYFGAELTPADWIKFGTFGFVGKGSGNGALVNISKPFNMTVGQTYGFYIVPYSSPLYYDVVDTTNNPKSNNDMSINSGASTAKLFGSIAPNRDWNGVFFYHFFTCNSDRVKGTLTMLQNPTGSTLSKSTPFNGSYATGLKKDPDMVCIGDTNTYSLTPPTGMSNSDYGTKWTITGFSFSTATGVATKDTMFRSPSGSKNAYVKFFPKSNPDSVYILKITVKTPSTGCDSTVFRYIQVNLKPTAKFTIGSVCTGKVVAITNNSTPTKDTYVWSFGNGDSAKGATPPYKYLTTGTYTVTLIASNGPCSSTTTQSITVYPSPVSSFITGSPFGGTFNSGTSFDPDNVCTSDTNTYQILPPKGLSNSDYNTKWTITNMTFSTIYGLKSTDTLFKKPTSSKNANFLFFPTTKYGDSTFILKYTIRTLPGYCDSQMVRYIHVRVKPTAGFSFSNACNGNAVTFKDTTKSKISILNNWTWNFGDGTTAGTNQNPSHTYSKAGKYTVTLKAVTDAGCSSIASGIVEEYPRPTTKFGSVLNCNTFSSSFSDSSSIATGTVASYKWNLGDGSKANTTKSFSYTYPKSGFYNVKLVTTSGFGCKDSLTKKIRIFAKPVANFSYKNVCVGSMMYMQNNTVDSSNKGTYLWAFGDGSTSGSQSPGHIYKNNGSYRVTMQVTSGYGCSDSFYLYVTPYIKPNAKLFVNNACVGQSVTFSDSSGAPKGSTWTWNFGDKGTDFQITNATSHTYTKSGSYNVSVLVTNPGGCLDSQVKSMTVLDIPKPSFTNTTVCYTKGTQFTNNSTGPAPITYFWNFNDNGATDNTKNPNHTFSKPGTFKVKLVTLNSLGCSDSAVNNVNVIAPPVIKWIRKQTRYTVNFVPVDSTIGSFTWYFGTSTNDSSNKKSPTFTYPTGDAKYVLTIKVKNASGCISVLVDTIFTGKYNAIIEGGNSFKDVSVYPNPFEGSTNISYTLSGRSKVNIGIYDVQGRLVATVKDGEFNAGTYTDAFDARKAHVTEGVYYVRMFVNDLYYTTKIVNLK